MTALRRVLADVERSDSRRAAAFLGLLGANAHGAAPELLVAAMLLRPSAEDNPFWGALCKVRPTTLGRVKLPHYANQLLPRHPDPAPVIAVVKLRDPEVVKAAVPTLIGVLKKKLPNSSPSPDQPQPLPGTFGTLEDSHKVAVIALAKIGKEAVSGLADALANEDDVVRLAAAITLQSIGPDAKETIPALEKAAKDPDNDVAKAASAALMKIAKPPK